MSYSRAIARCITDYLDADDWNYQLDEQKELIRMNLTLNNKMKKVSIIIDLRDDKYLVFMSYPLGADKEDRVTMSDLLNRINYTLMFGCFEMDNSDGEVRFRLAVDCEDSLPSREIVKNSIMRAAASCQKYGNAIVQVVMGMATAEEAFNSTK